MRVAYPKIRLDYDIGEFDVHAPRFIRTRKVVAWTLMNSGSKMFNLGLKIYPHRDANLYEDAMNKAFTAEVVQ